MINLDRWSGTAAPTAEHWTLFTQEEFRALPDEHQDQFWFLDEESTQAAYEAAHQYNVICGGDVWGNDPFAGGCYASVDRMRLQCAWDGRLSVTEKWLYQCGVPFAADALTLPVFTTDRTPAVQATWKMVVKYAAEVFFSENVVVADPSLKWCLYYHHDDIFSFARGRNWRFVPENG